MGDQTWHLRRVGMQMNDGNRVTLQNIMKGEGSGAFLDGVHLDEVCLKL